MTKRPKKLKKTSRAGIHNRYDKGAPKRRIINNESIFSINNPFLENNKESVINLSKRVLTPSETLLLCLGTKFIPNLRIYYKNSVADSTHVKNICNYVRKVFIRKHFCSQPSSIDLNDIFRVKNPNYHAPNQSDTKFKVVKHYVNSIHSNLLSQRSKKVHYDKSRLRPILPSHLNKALKSLRADKDIVIKAADKNLGLVIMDKEFYITQVLTHLNNKLHYSLVASPPSLPYIYEKINVIVKKYSSYFSSHANEKRYILQNIDKCNKYCKFYLLMKVHKTGSRPICSNLSFPTYFLSKFIHIKLLHIQNYFSMIDSSPLLKNSRTLVDILDRTHFPRSCVLVSADITSLYPSIPLEEGILAVRHFVYSKACDIDTTEEKELVLESLRCVLFNCYLIFEKVVYLQIQGTAMGTPCAVVFANLFLLSLELKVSNSLHLSAMLLFKRYIDDIFAIFCTTLDAINYIKMYNSIFPSIKIDAPTISERSANILDITVDKCSPISLDNDEYLVYPNNHLIILRTCLFVKPMNKFLYIPPNSCHPKHIFSNWIKSEINRICFICSDDVQYSYYRKFFYDKLVNRGYKTIDLDEYFTHDPIRRMLLLKHGNMPFVQNQDSRPLRLITSYDNLSVSLNFAKIIQPSDDIKMFEPDYKAIFGAKPAVSYSMQPNLGRLLTR